ncbi:MAG: FAD-dependent oxidoreductase [Halodesulfurarchaeum sp.]
MDDVAVRVRAVSSVGADTVAMTFEAPPDFDAAPGQFIQVSARIDDDLVQRYFTISSPGVEGTFEITVGVDPDGSLTPWLADREPGDTVRMSGPYGGAYYEGESSVVVLAAGPGIGPAVGIGERALELGNRVAIVVPPDTETHRERLRRLSADGAFVIDSGEGLQMATADALDHVDGTIFVYGFAPFVSDAVEAIEAAGRDPDEAKVESFGPG